MVNDQFCFPEGFSKTLSFCPANIGQQGLWRSYSLRDLAQQSIPEKLSSFIFHCLPVPVTSCMNTLNSSIIWFAAKNKWFCQICVCHGDLLDCASRSALTHNSPLPQDLRFVRPVPNFRDWVITYSKACPQSSLGTRLINDCCVMPLLSASLIQFKVGLVSGN